MKNTIAVVLFLMVGPSFAQETKITLLRTNALDCSWNPKNEEQIAYSMKGSDTYYDIYMMSPDGKKDTCLTCDHPMLPNRHISNVAWHPSGEWIIFIAEKKEHPRSSTHALPGFGAYNDIYIMNIRDSKKCYKLVELANDYDHGVICPRFSNDGKKLVWTDRIKRPNFASLKRTFGYWDMKMVDVYWDQDSIPHVKNQRVIQPGKNCFYECYGFSPDDKRLVFCSSMNMPSVWSQNIYTIDTSGNDLQKLTEENYNEHGCYSPDGKKILWMSNTGAARPKEKGDVRSKNGTDWWIMDADGSNKKRLTYMNEPGHKQFEGKSVWAGLVSFSPDGKRFVGGVQISLITQEGKIVIVDLP